MASRVRVITHPRARLKNRASAAADAAATAASTAPRSVPTVSEGTVDLVAIGASTGGPQALAHLLGALPIDFAPAIVVVQHMADGFIEGLASWLDTLCALPVGIATDGCRLSGGTVTIAPGARNLIVNDHLRVSFEPPAETQYHIPGVDATFESVARNIGPRAIGVLLTGMGRDGAVGLKAMRDAGAITIGQDEESSTVYGMPGAAVARGAVQRQLPLVEIAPALVAILQGDCVRRQPMKRFMTDDEFDVLRRILEKTAGLVHDESRRDALAFAVAGRSRQRIWSRSRPILR